MRCKGTCATGRQCNNVVKDDGTRCYLHNRTQPEDILSLDSDDTVGSRINGKSSLDFNDPIVIRVNGKLFETFRARAKQHSKLLCLHLEEYLPSNDGVYNIGDTNKIDSLYVWLIINYINTGKFPLHDGIKKNVTFLTGMSKACGYFGVDVVPDEVYFLSSFWDDNVNPRPMVRIYDFEVVDFQIKKCYKTRSIFFEEKGRYRGQGMTRPMYKEPILQKRYSRGKVPDFKRLNHNVTGVCSIEGNIYVVYHEYEGENTQVARYFSLGKEWEYNLPSSNAPAPMPGYLYPGKEAPVSNVMHTMKRSRVQNARGGEIVSVGSTIYVISGISNWSYDTKTGEWCELEVPPGCDKELDGTICVVDQDIFLFCGRSYWSHGTKGDQNILKFNTESNSWTVLSTKMPNPSYGGYSVCLMDGMVYIVGTGKNHEDVHCFDPSNYTFKEHSKIIRTGRFMGGCFVMNDILHISPEIGRIQWYCTTSKSWKETMFSNDVEGMFSVVIKGGGTLARAGSHETENKREKADRNLFDLLLEAIDEDDDHYIENEKAKTVGR
jgi:hypothetical protein